MFVHFLKLSYDSSEWYICLLPMLPRVIFEFISVSAMRNIRSQNYLIRGRVFGLVRGVSACKNQKYERPIKFTCAPASLIHAGIPKVEFWHQLENVECWQQVEFCLYRNEKSTRLGKTGRDIGGLIATLLVASSFKNIN